MIGFVNNIEKLTLENSNYRKVIYTGNYSQLVLMCLKPGENIHKEVHPTVDQFFRIEQGNGIAIINNKKYKLYDGIGLIIPAGYKHQIINTSKTKELKLYTIYTPPEHKDKLIQKDKPMNQDGGKIYFKFNSLII